MYPPQYLLRFDKLTLQIASMVTNEPLPRILQLAAAITESVRKLQDSLSENGLPTPSFNENESLSIPEEASGAQDVILDATAELHDLLLDPLVLVRSHGGVRPQMIMLDVRIPRLTCIAQ